MNMQQLHNRRANFSGHFEVKLHQIVIIDQLHSQYYCDCTVSAANYSHVDLALL